MHSPFRGWSGSTLGMPPLPAPGSPEAKRKKAIIDFLILLPFTISFLGIALALGTEPRMLLERTGKQVFRVTGSNHFAGFQFYSKTIEGVESVNQRNAYRGRREDSMQERNRQMKRVRLDFDGADGSRLGWGRVSDQRLIDDFMHGDSPTLALAAPPPFWRAGLTWLSAALGGLIFIGTVQNSFFPKKSPFA